MHTGLYTTYKNISERVLRIIDADNYDDSDAQVFIADALNLIGVHHAYEPKKCFIDIEQHRGELPKDITYMIAVRGNSYKNGITSHTIASTEIPQTNITTDLTGNGNPNTVLGSGTFAGQTYLDTNSENTYEWDGKGQDGSQLEQGHYAYHVNAMDLNGELFDGQPFMTGTITGVQYYDGAAWLQVGDAHISMSDVVEITQGESKD